MRKTLGLTKRECPRVTLVHDTRISDSFYAHYHLEILSLNHLNEIYNDLSNYFERLPNKKIRFSQNFRRFRNQNKIQSTFDYSKETYTKHTQCILLQKKSTNFRKTVKKLGANTLKSSTWQYTKHRTLIVLKRSGRDLVWRERTTSTGSKTILGWKSRSWCWVSLREPVTPGLMMSPAGSASDFLETSDVEALKCATEDQSFNDRGSVVDDRGWDCVYVGDFDVIDFFATLKKRLYSYNLSVNEKKNYLNFWRNFFYFFRKYIIIFSYCIVSVKLNFR